MSARALACVVLVAFGSAGAQTGSEVRIEGGVAQLRQFGRDERGAFVLGAVWRETDRRLATLVSGEFTYAGDSLSAAQGIAALAWRPSNGSAWHTEGGVTGAVFGVYDLGRGGNESVYARERLVLDGGSLWAGGFAGHTGRDGRSWHSTDIDIGGAVRSGGLEGSLSFARLRTNDWPLMEASGIFLQSDAASHNIQDATLAAHYARGPLTIGASHTWRGGLRQTTATQTAFAWSAEYVLTSRFAVAVGGGRQLADPIRGTPDAHITSALVRVAVLPWRAANPADALVASARLAGTAGGAVLIVHVVAADSARVEVAGSFSAWEPVALRRTPDGWEAQVPLGPGTHRVAVRINGGPWRAPANLGKVRDEFGGEAGIVVVP
ncbi:MAG: glycogen-binding domain-containing protein [Gemmatimonadales bacterium]